MKPDTGSGYASKSVNFTRIEACQNTHQNLSTFQGLIRIEKCHLSRKINTHYTHYTSKSVNFPREISTKPVFAELVYQKRPLSPCRLPIDGKKMKAGRVTPIIASTHWGSGTAPPYASTNQDVVVENEPHAALVPETSVAIEPLRARLRVHLASTSRFGTSSPAQSTHPDTRNTTTVPEMPAGANDRDRITHARCE
jgi:hypothetical protein